MALPSRTRVLERLPGHLETGQCLDKATTLIFRKYGEILFLLLAHLFNVDRNTLRRVLPTLLSEFLLRAFSLADDNDCRQPTKGQHGRNTDE